MHDVIDNRGSRRFELLEHGQVAYADYEIDGDRLILPHVEAPIGLRGTGAAGRLMEAAATMIRSKNDPSMSRSMVRLIGREFVTSDERARRELGYVGHITRAEGLRDYV